MSVEQIAGQYQLSKLTFADGQTIAVQVDAKGRLIVTSDSAAPVVTSQTMPPNYETVAASQTDQVLGTLGAIGDFISSLHVVVAVAATAQVSIKDGAGSSIVVFPALPGGGIGAYDLPIGIKSVAGAWSVTTGAGVSVIATGTFS